jgi:hypothetical protein
MTQVIRGLTREQLIKRVYGQGQQKTDCPVSTKKEPNDDSLSRRTHNA